MQAAAGRALGIRASLRRYRFGGTGQHAWTGLCVQVEDMAEEEKDEEPPVIASAPRTITEAEQARVAQIERNKAMMEKMFDL